MASEFATIGAVAAVVLAVEVEFGLPDVAVIKPASCELDAVAAPLAPVGVPVAVSSPSCPDPVFRAAVAVESVKVEVSPVRAVLENELTVVVLIGVM